MNARAVFDDSDFFDEDAISESEAWDACERFVAYREGEGLAFKLYAGEQAQRLISKAEILHFLEQRLEDCDSKAAQLHLLEQRLEDGETILVA